MAPSATPTSAVIPPNATQDVVLAMLASKAITVEAASKWLEVNAKRKNNGNLYCRVSAKGAVSVYGMGQWPLTLYAAQWERLLEGCPDDHFVLKFIQENEGKEYHHVPKEGSKTKEYTATINRK